MVDVTGSLASDTTTSLLGLVEGGVRTQARLLSSWISRVISVPPRTRTGFQIDLYPSEHCQHVKVRTVRFSFTESPANYVDTIQAVQAEPSGRPKRQGFTSQFHSPVCVRRTVWSSTAVVVTNLLCLH